MIWLLQTLSPPWGNSTLPYAADMKGRPPDTKPVHHSIVYDADGGCVGAPGVDIGWWWLCCWSGKFMTNFDLLLAYPSNLLPLALGRWDLTERNTYPKDSAMCGLVLACRYGGQWTFHAYDVLIIPLTILLFPLKQSQPPCPG